MAFDHRPRSLRLWKHQSRRFFDRLEYNSKVIPIQKSILSNTTDSKQECVILLMECWKQCEQSITNIISSFKRIKARRTRKKNLLGRKPQAEGWKRMKAIATDQAQIHNSWSEKWWNLKGEKAFTFKLLTQQKTGLIVRHPPHGFLSCTG